MNIGDRYHLAPGAPGIVVVRDIQPEGLILVENHRRLRHVFFMAAFSSAQREGPSREFYQRKRAEHQRHVQATIALARRLVDVLWALLRDDREWVPEPLRRAA